MKTLKWKIDTKNKWLKKLMPSTKTQLGKSIQVIQERADRAVKYMEMTSVIKHGDRVGLDTLPWYLLIGPKGAGKTSLLNESNVNFVAGDQKKPTASEKNEANISCNWWITSDAVIIDVPGGFAPNQNKKSFGGDLWEYLLGLVQNRRAKNDFGGVIIAISVTQLLDRNYRNILVEYLRARILETQHYFGKETPFYITLTKTDLLPGFADFFGDMTLEEQAQAWGITMPEVGMTETLSSLFIKRFNALIKILNRQVIPRLHRERDLIAKANIKNFPLHLERVKDEFASILNTLAALDVKFATHGVYLNSVVQNKLSKQDGVHCRMIWDNDPLEFKPVLGDMAENTPFFVRQFLMHGILV